MAAVITVIAGRYSSTYTPSANANAAGGGGGAVDLGITNDPGYKLGFTWDFENVQDTDAYGRQVIEQIFLGPSEVSLDFISKEIKAGPISAIQPFSTYTPTGATSFKPGLVGRRASDLAGSVIMSSTTGTPAVSTPASMTFTFAIIHEGVNTELIFGPRHRTVPVRFRILPSDAGSGAAQYFTAT